MKNFMVRLGLATAVAILACALGTSADAQQGGDNDPAPATPHHADAATASAQQSGEAQMPASGNITTRETKTFTGRVVKENGELVLKDPVTKVTYKLDDPAKAKQYIGKPVKVTGKLDMNTNKILMQSILLQNILMENIEP